MTQAEHQVFCRLVYADIFHWPLKFSELHTSQKIIHSLINQKKISQKDGYCFLSGQEKTISLRKKREEISNQKLSKAQKLAKFLDKLHWIKLVAVTGNVAVGNSQPADDIDILLITAKNRLWLVRPLVILCLSILGWRRKPSDHQAKDKFCLNLWLDEAGLKLPVSKQTYYTIREIKQMKVLLDKDNTYKKFIDKNSWLKKF